MARQERPEVAPLPEPPAPLEHLDTAAPAAATMAALATDDDSRAPDTSTR